VIFSKYMGRLVHKYCAATSKGRVRCKAFAMLKRAMPTHLQGLVPHNKRLHAKEKAAKRIGQFHHKIQAKRQRALRAIGTIIKKYCSKKDPLFCELMKGVRANFKISQRGGKAEKELERYLGLLKKHYCSKPQQMKTRRCALFPLLAKQQPLNKKKEAREVQKTKNMVTAMDKTITHYCVGKSKLMCQISKEIKAQYLKSLKPGKRDLLFNYIKSLRKNFCKSGAEHKKRCAMFDIFWKANKKHRLRPEKIHKPVKIKKKTGAKSGAKSSSADRDKLTKLMKFYCSKPTKYKSECDTYRKLVQGKTSNIKVHTHKLKPAAKPKKTPAQTEAQRVLALLKKPKRL
jgi:hypothetical protein